MAFQDARDTLFRNSITVGELRQGLTFAVKADEFLIAVRYRGAWRLWRFVDPFTGRADRSTRAATGQIDRRGFEVGRFGLQPLAQQLAHGQGAGPALHCAPIIQPCEEAAREGNRTYLLVFPVWAKARTATFRWSTRDGRSSRLEHSGAILPNSRQGVKSAEHRPAKPRPTDPNREAIRPHATRPSPGSSISTHPTSSPR